MNAEQQRIAVEIRCTMETAANEYLELARSLRGFFIKVDGLGRVYWHLPQGYLITAITSAGRPIGLHLNQERADSARLAVFTTKEEADRWLPSMTTHDGYEYFMAEHLKTLDHLELLLKAVA